MQNAIISLSLSLVKTYRMLLLIQEFEILQFYFLCKFLIPLTQISQGFSFLMKGILELSLNY